MIIKTTKHKTIFEYIWLDSNKRFRSKKRVACQYFEKKPYIEEIGVWNYDGSSTGQASGHENTEIILKPIYVCKSPFKANKGCGVEIAQYLVLCDTYNSNGTPTQSNTRHTANELFNKKSQTAELTWYGIEQEYFIFKKNTKLPYGWDENKSKTMKPQGDYYCNMGNEYGKIISDTHLEYCIFAGIDISGTNAEVAPGQWEYQVGPCGGINVADQLMMSRYILEQVANAHDCYIVWDPKPLSIENGYNGQWNGSGCHINFSTFETRHGTNHKNGFEYMKIAIEKLSKTHEEHMAVYGEGNELRMSGECETASYNTFSWGIGTRNTSIRIGNEIAKQKYGYFEDRRPASNMDPYLATSILFKTICL